VSSYPFGSIEELKQQARLLKNSFDFYSIRFSGAPENLSLQQTHELIAKAFGFMRWEDLTQRVIGQCSVSYLDDRHTAETIHQAVAEKMHKWLGGDISVERIYNAIALAQFGRSVWFRDFATNFFRNLPKNCKIAEQWGMILKLEAGYSYVSRYNYRRTPWENRLLEYEKQKALAQILGTPLPRKPRRRNADK